jgi:hypothetical protein
MLHDLKLWLNLNSAAVTAASVFITAMVWMIDRSYKFYGSYMIVISKWQQILILNEVTVRNNLRLMREWSDHISTRRPYSCSFGTLIYKDEDFFIRDKKLANNLIKIRFESKQSYDDLTNLYKGYSEVLPAIFNISDVHSRDKELQRYSTTVKNALDSIIESHESIQKDIFKAIAKLQVIDRVGFHSFFGYFNKFLLKSIWPTVTEKKISEKLKENEKQIEIT